MSTRRLYVDTRLAAGDSLHLDGEEAHYIGRVLRCRPGDDITLFNGDGYEFSSRIEEIDKSGVTLAIRTALQPVVESPLELRLIQGISRGERMDTVVQKATELGVRRISPVQSEYSVVRLDRERSEKRLLHWRRISQSACEQCGRTVPPQLDVPCTLKEAFCGAAGPGTARLMLEPGGEMPVDAVTTRPARVELLVGPEGGFSDSELGQAMEAGFVAVSLGPRTLRTETAAIAALTLAQALWGDLCGDTRR